MIRGNICFAVKLGVVRLVLIQNVIDSSEQYPSNGNNSFFVTSALLNREIPIADFWVTFSMNGTSVYDFR